MEYVIKCGKNYVGFNGHGQYIEVTNIASAIKGSMHKMSNLVNNCISPNVRKKCKIVELSEANKPVISCVIKTQPTNSAVDNIVSEIKKIDSSLFDAEKDVLNKKLSVVDQEITDIQYYIEFNRLNAADGYKAFKLLQDKLLERRVIKNDVTKFQILSDAKISDVFNGNLEKSLSSLENKKYTPRVLKSLFEEDKR